MPLVLAALLTASAALPASLPACSWNRPGHQPFMGDVVAAVDRYRDIPAPVRARLKERLASRAYDEMVSIRRDAIVGQARYRPEIRDMHFGTGQVCGSVNRLQWTSDAEQPGLVYCEAGYCILVPTVSRNISRISRENPAVAGAEVPAGGGGEAGGGAGGGGAGGGGAAFAGEGGGLGGSLISAAMPAAEASGQEAAAPTSFVAGLSETASAGSAGSWAAGALPAGGTGLISGGGGGNWLAAAAWRSPAGGRAIETMAVAPSRVTSNVKGGGVPAVDMRAGLPGAGGGLIGGTGFPRGNTPGGGSPSPANSPLIAPVIAVPEPGTWVLMFAGLAALAWRVRRRA